MEEELAVSVLQLVSLAVWWYVHQNHLQVIMYTARIISLNSDTTYIETGVPDLGLRAMMDICFEVQVEAEVKLEVLAKFCFPRENDIEIPTYVECPTFEWPEQCDFFPRENCDCQAFVDTNAITGPVAIH